MFGFSMLATLFVWTALGALLISIATTLREDLRRARISSLVAVIFAAIAALASVALVVVMAGFPDSQFSGFPAASLVVLKARLIPEWSRSAAVGCSIALAGLGIWLTARGRLRPAVVASWAGAIMGTIAVVFSVGYLLVLHKWIHFLGLHNNSLRFIDLNDELATWRATLVPPWVRDALITCLFCCVAISVLIVTRRRLQNGTNSAAKLP